MAATEPPSSPQSMAPPPREAADPDALADALNNLRSSDPEIRADAVLDIEPEGVGLRTLVDTLGDPDKDVRLAVVSQLEDAESPEAVAGLVRALGDADPDVVLEAIDALEFVGDQNVVGDLRRLLDSQNAEIKEAAQDAIEYLEED
jgi:HEAT repeat protein